MDTVIESDVIEIIYFKNINNDALNIKIIQNQDLLLPDWFNVDNCVLFSSEIENPTYTLDNSDMIQYNVEFTYTKNNNKYQFTLNNPYYYSKPLIISETRQFRYYTEQIIEEKVVITLPSYFKYCQDISLYTVFINGKKIEKDHCKITKMTQTTAFDKLLLYISFILYPGDRVDIFYVPDLVQELEIRDSIEINGDIIIDTSKLPYILDKKLYFIFINGKKIESSNIINMSINKLRIKNDIKSINNLCIMKYIQNVDDLLDPIINTENWTAFVDGLDIDTVNLLFMNNNNINNIDENFKTSILNKKSIIYEIIKDNYIQYNPTYALPFTYDYDNIVLSEDDKDIDDAYIIRLLDANNYDKVPFTNRDAIST
jgi:hypothetical protein